MADELLLLVLVEVELLLLFRQDFETDVVDVLECDERVLMSGDGILGGFIFRWD